jgi:pimeloyl-ACP methyl ester carboxylesterase
VTVAQAPATPVAPAILFIHGYAQAALSRAQQTRDAALALEFRMVALDLRGHGMSDKPIGHEHYRTNQFWADDIQAVIQQTQLDQPTLVGRSYGGRVMGDYVNEHGTGAIGAMNWVGAVSSSSVASRFGRGGRFMGGMTSPNPASAIAGTISFQRECFTIQPNASDFEAMLAFNMMVPRHVRISLGGRQVAFEQRLPSLDVPTLITHGSAAPPSSPARGSGPTSISATPPSRRRRRASTGNWRSWRARPGVERRQVTAARIAPARCGRSARRPRADGRPPARRVPHRHGCLRCGR